MAAIFGETNFLEIGLTTLQTYPVAQKFRRNRSISHGFQDTGILVFCIFCEKFENSKWPPVLATQTFFDKKFENLKWPSFWAKIL